MFLPVHWLFFAASTYVWVQFVWHTGNSIEMIFSRLVALEAGITHSHKEDFQCLHFVRPTGGSDVNCISNSANCREKRFDRREFFASLLKKSTAKYLLIPWSNNRLFYRSRPWFMPTNR